MAKPVFLKVKAVKRGTLAHRTGTYHFDPKSKHIRARERSVPPEVAEALKAKGLVKIVGEGSQRTAGNGIGASLGINVSLLGADRREESAGEEHTGFVEAFGAGGADTRDTTAFQRKPTGLSLDEAAGSDTPRQIRKGSERDQADGLLEDVDPEDEDDTDRDDEDLDEDEEEERLIDDALRAPGEDQLRQEGDAGGGDSPPREPGEGGEGGEGGGQTGTGEGGAAGGTGDQAPPPPGQKAAVKPAAAKTGAAKPGTAKRS